MAAPPSTLGTQLRHLLELLDGAVERAYVDAGLDYRPRYTPVMRVLVELDTASIRTIAERAGVTHSAASQTVAQMTERGLVALVAGSDGRERLASLTPAARDMIPALDRQWTATNAAARELDAELSTPLSAVLGEAIAALARASFDQRISRAAGTRAAPSAAPPRRSTRKPSRK